MILKYVVICIVGAKSQIPRGKEQSRQQHHEQFYWTAQAQQEKIVKRNEKWNVFVIILLFGAKVLHFFK